MFVTCVTLMLRTYTVLQRYAGTKTSLGASGNQPTAGTAPIETVTLQPGWPTQPTRAGAYTGRTTNAPGAHAHTPPIRAQRP